MPLLSLHPGGLHPARIALRVSARRALLATLTLWLVCAGALCNSTFAQTRTQTVLHDFSLPPKGSYPDAALVQDSSGNFYGTTEYDGREGGGTVFQLAPGGALTVLHNFAYELGNENTTYEPAGVVLDAAGNLYGTAASDAGFGAVYKVTPAGEEIVLHLFQGGSDGVYPTGALLLDSAGNIYGVTSGGGGSSGFGIVFKLDPAGNETILHYFLPTTEGAAPNGNIAYGGGAEPNGNLVFDGNGNLVGTTRYGGSENAGVIYRLSPSGAETVLYSFTGNADGYSPNAGLTLDPAGNLYGTTLYGGSDANSKGYGVVFKLDVQNNYTVLHTFQGGSDTVNPNSALVRDQNGNLYGTASYSTDPTKGGAVFKVSAAGQESVLLAFTDFVSQGIVPIGLLLGSNGDLFGVAAQGGSSGEGLVYSLTPSGQQTVLYTFPNSHGGYNPISNVAFDKSGNLWGVTDDSPSTVNGYQKETVYKISASGQETVLYDFGPLSYDGYGASSGIVFDQAGNAYGETFNGGAYDVGQVYKITPDGQETIFYSFSKDNYGGVNPVGGLAIDSAGNLYGSTYDSVVFKLDPAGNETVLCNLGEANAGVQPEGGVVLDSKGNLYGTTNYGGVYGEGAVFKLSPDGQVQVLHSFTGLADGGRPQAGVVLGLDGNVYGTTAYGGSEGSGVVFELSGGVEKVLLNFGAINASGPNPLICDAQGNIYGTTSQGGTDGYGMVFEISAEGIATVLYNFTGGVDGREPAAGLLLGPSGALFGTASAGGKYTGGVVFELK